MQFLLWDCGARACAKGVFLFTDTGCARPARHSSPLLRGDYTVRNFVGVVEDGPAAAVSCGFIFDTQGPTQHRSTARRNVMRMSGPVCVYGRLARLSVSLRSRASERERERASDLRVEVHSNPTGEHEDISVKSSVAGTSAMPRLHVCRMLSESGKSVSLLSQHCHVFCMPQLPMVHACVCARALFLASMS